MFFDANPLFAMFGDKLLAKAWMARHVPELELASTLWVADTLADFRQQTLSQQSVIKLSRGCAKNLFLDNDNWEKTRIEAILKGWLRQSYRELLGRRFGPKTDKRIFAEAIISKDREHILDLNFFCCGGKVLFVVATTGEKTRHERVAYFAPDGRRIGSVEQDPAYRRNWLPPDFALPECYDQALKAAETLSRSIDFVRVDLMCADGRLFACEMTPFPGIGAYMQTALVEASMRSWDLRQSWFMQARHKGFMHLYQQALWRQLRRQP